MLSLRVGKCAFFTDSTTPIVLLLPSSLRCRPVDPLGLRRAFRAAPASTRRRIPSPLAEGGSELKRNSIPLVLRIQTGICGRTTQEQRFTHGDTLSG